MPSMLAVRTGGLARPWAGPAARGRSPSPPRVGGWAPLMEIAEIVALRRNGTDERLAGTIHS
jgi:hypothetical protein